MKSSRIFFKFLLVLQTLFITTGCSTLGKQLFYSGLAGAVVGASIGAIIGKELSPNSKSDGLNQAIGASSGIIVGGLAGAGLGTFFWNQNPENKALPPMILDQRAEETAALIGAQGRVNSEIKQRPLRPEGGSTYPLEEGPIPEKYRHLLNKKGQVRLYNVPAYTEVQDDGREITHEEHKAWEYIIEAKAEEISEVTSAK
jgi:hypothetical protein